MLEFIFALIGATLLVTLSLAILEKHAHSVKFNPNNSISTAYMRIIPQKRKEIPRQTGTDKFQQTKDPIDQIVEERLDPSNSGKKYIEKYVDETVDSDPLPEIETDETHTSTNLNRNIEDSKEISDKLDSLISKFDKKLSK